jgi:hypothetical protein
MLSPETGTLNEVNVIVVCVEDIELCRVYVPVPAGKNVAIYLYLVYVNNFYDAIIVG